MARRLIMIFVLLGLSPLPVHAEECLVCDSEIVITSRLAGCFISQVDGLIDDMRRQKLPYQLVNLGTCDGIDGPGRGGSASIDDSARQIVPLPGDIRNAEQGTPTEPTTTFILDEAGLRCLADAIRADLASFDPAAAFRPSQMCP